MISIFNIIFIRPIRYAGDIVGQDLSLEEKANALPKVQAQLQRSEKTVKQLRSKVRRLNGKLKNMEDLLAKLSSEQLISNTVDSILQVFGQKRWLRFITFLIN